MQRFFTSLKIVFGWPCHQFASELDHTGVQPPQQRIDRASRTRAIGRARIVKVAVTINDRLEAPRCKIADGADELRLHAKVLWVSD